MLHVHFTLLLAGPAAFSPLHAEHVEATSFLQCNWNTYEENDHPNSLSTATRRRPGVEGNDGDGVGESITVPVSTLKIGNGHQKSRYLVEANGAPATITIIVTGPDGRTTETTGATTASPTRTMGRQQTTVPVKIGSIDVVTNDDDGLPGDPEGLVRRRWSAVPVVATAGAP